LVNAQTPEENPPLSLHPESHAGQPTSTGSPINEVAYEPDGELQPLPLNSIWPVTRIQEKKPVIQPETSEPVHRLLEKLEPGQETSSKIEVITPHSPRPVLTHQNMAGQAATHSEIPKPAVLSANKPAHDIQDDHTSPMPHESTPAVVQQKADNAIPPQTMPLSPSMELVQTEIGELPADLWSLLGETPPPQKTLQTAQSIPAETVSTHQVTSDLQPAIPETTKQPTTNRPPLPIQMEPADSPEASQNISGNTSEITKSAPAKETGEQKGEMDTDELARRVYSEIKRRLSVEWERLRHWR